MTIIEAFVSFADAVTDDGIDYGTGYYLTQAYSDGTRDYFGPFDYASDAINGNNAIGE